MKTVCIMGGGLGGLVTGALLAREGFVVTVLEKNNAVGGGLQSFRRGRYTFDTGMHIFGGMGENGQLRLILRHLGIEDKLQLDTRTEVLVDTASGRLTTLPTGRDAWVSQFPKLRSYLDRLYHLTLQEPLYNMQASLDGSTIPDMSLSVGDLMADIDRTMSHISILYDACADSPALLHALIACSHIDGVHSFRHNSSDLANLLCTVIEDAGGKVMTGEEVTNIVAAGRKVEYIQTTNNSYSADCYISDIPIGKFIQLAPHSVFSPATHSRIVNAKYTASAFLLFIGLKPKSLPYNREVFFVSDDGQSPWFYADYSECHWPKAAFALPHQDDLNPGYADTVKVVCPISYDAVSQWTNSTVGHRPPDYYGWKELMATRILAFLAPLGIAGDAIQLLETASPLTIRDYYGVPRGALYGIKPLSSQPLQTAFTPHTRLTNLFLTGQDINFHGMIGTSLSAILTAESIVGRNTIVKQLIKQ